MKRTLNDRVLKSLKPAAGKLYDVADTVVPGFGVRVSETGRKTFVLVTRFPGHPNPTRRALGTYGALDLAAARTKARKWLALIAQNKDPAAEIERQRDTEARKRATTFAAVAEDFAKEKLVHERRGKHVARDIERVFAAAWGKRPIADITDLDVLTIIRAKKATAPEQARSLLGIAKRLFQWAIDQRVYGLTTSPCTHLRPAAIVGEKPHGSRVLDDAELFALWRAASRMKYPHGSVYQLLMLTGLRLNEVADAHWTEFTDGIWTIPAERMKGKNTRARAHAVPLTADIVAVLDKLPKFNRGKFLFSTSFGETAAWMTDRVKKHLDARMLRTLRAMAIKRGEDSADVELKPWVNHDIRRTVRTRLSRLKISEEAREAVLAHARPGIKGVYDAHDYLDEKREALELWAARLRSIVEPMPEPEPATVISMRHRS